MQRLALLAGVLAAFGLRLYQLGAESLWYDETVSVYLARQSLPALLAHTAGDIHPPGYYLLLHAWQSLAQPTLHTGLEFLFAWPSLWAGMLIVALLYPLGRRLVGTPAALLGLWLAATSPFGIWYSQEVRMYTVGAALGLLCLWALLRFLDGRRRYRWLGVYALAAAAGPLRTLLFCVLAHHLESHCPGRDRLERCTPGQATAAGVDLAGGTGGRVRAVAALAAHLLAPGDRPAGAAVACALGRVSTNCSPAWLRQAARCSSAKAHRSPCRSCGLAPALWC